MTIFRPCIDIHAGQVKQIVGGTLSDGSDDSSSLKTNHVSLHSATYFAQLYRCYGLRGGHVIMLGPHNEQAAKEALQSWPQGLHIGGGITDINAEQWITSGAEKVIVTSFLFPDGTFSQSRLQSCLKALGDDRNKLVVDLSCRRKGSTWYVATDKWQTLTSYEISAANIQRLEGFCSEFLIHAADNEGLQSGIDEDLVRRLAHICHIPVTYAGGAKSLSDLQRVQDVSDGKIDVTIGSALDIFGGTLVKLSDCVGWNNRSQVSIGNLD